MMFKDSRVQKGPGEGKSVVFQEWQIATKERKEKKKEYLTKHKITKYQSPTVPPSSVTHAIGGIVRVIPWCLWSHISAALFRFTVLFLKSFTIKVTASNTAIWFPRLTNILHNIKAYFLQQKAIQQCEPLRIYWSWIFGFEFWQCFYIICKDMYKLDIRS